MSTSIWRNRVVGVQDVCQVEVRPQPNVDVEEGGIAADFHFHEVDRGCVSSWEVDQAWNARQSSKLPSKTMGAIWASARNAEPNMVHAVGDVVKRFHFIPRYTSEVPLLAT